MTVARLSAIGISKAFPGVQALNRVDLSLMPGEIQALVGENGSGKSTLLKIACGAYQPDSGHLELDGRPVRFRGTWDALRNGVIAVHQEPLIVPDLTVAENIALGNMPVRSGAWVDKAEMRRAARQALMQLGLDLSVDTPAKALTIAQRQLMMLSRAFLSSQPKVVLLDEPTASLSKGEIATLFDLLRRLAGRGVAVLSVLHRLDEVFELADTVTVLRDGCRIASLSTSDTDPDRVVHMMVGRGIERRFAERVGAIGNEVLRVSNLTAARVRGVSFTVRSGEIVGMAGLVGSGRTETARAIMGVDRRKGGSVTMDGREIRPGRVADSIASGLAFLTEDRRGEGIIPDLGVRSNTVMVSLRRLAHLGVWLNRRAENETAQEYVSKLNIATPSIEHKVKFLSGGNQQKVVLSRWLAADSRVLILDEPTKGIDVGAKAEIYDLILELAASGVGILLISSDLPEILGLADRTLVMRDGRVVDEVLRGPDAETRIGQAMMGVGDANAVQQGTP